jgi:hypothetical protein
MPFHLNIKNWQNPKHEARNKLDGIKAKAV